MCKQHKVEALLSCALEARRLEEEVNLKQEAMDEERLQIHLLAQWRDEENYDLVEEIKRKR